MNGPSLETRVARLERQLNRWKLTAGGLAVLVIAAIAFGATSRDSQKVPEVIRAKRFEVVGATGGTKAYLGTLNGNSDFGILRLFDNEGKECFTARTGENETFVYLVNGKQQIGLTTLRDENQPAGISISTTEPNGQPYAKVVWKAP
jgi:hypothetical protein